MNTSFEIVRSVLDSLPIGYYAGHPIAVTLDRDGTSTYFDTNTESITISFPMIANALATAPDTTDPESLIRGLLYHEVSHALLTPNDLFNMMRSLTRLTTTSHYEYAHQAHLEKVITREQFDECLKECELKANEIANIAEDERIETLLHSYYMNVDFKRNLVLLNGIDPRANLEQKGESFYNVVRYRVTNHPEWFDLVNDFSTVNFAKPNTFTDLIYDFCNKVLLLYVQIWVETHRSKSKSKSKPTPSPSSEPSKSESKSKSKSKPTLKPSAEQLEQIAQNVSEQAESTLPSNGSMTLSDIKSTLSNASTNPELAKMRTTVKSSVEQALKRRGHFSASTNAHTGRRINPRSVGNADYRWFNRPSQSGDLKQFDKIHFNLWVDCSGSFSNSAPKINALIKCLSDLEQEMPDFSMDVIRVGSKYHNQLADKSDMFITPRGSSHVDNDLSYVYKQVQRPQTSNYNIVVFDGEMELLFNTSKGVLSTFNHPNCYMVIDSTNWRWEDSNPKATVKMIDTDYADNFIDTVNSLISKALS